jgi:hypothetical protein
VRGARGGLLVWAALVGVAAPARAQDKPLREWMQDARSADTRAAAVGRFRSASAADLPELKLLVDDARRVPGEGVARMLEDPRRACRSRSADPDAWLTCLVEQLEGKTTVNAKSATSFACALIGARSAKGIDGYALAASLELDAKGAFEGAIASTLKSGGDEAIAALYTVRRDGAVPLRKWAAERLEALKKRKPADLASMTDPKSVARVFTVLGGWREPEALGLLIDHVDADRREVREAAREAVRAYGREAIWKLREAWRNVAGQAAPEDWYSKRLADELFARLDAQRLGPAMAALEDARNQAKDGKPRAAAEAAERALRLAADHPDRRELAGFLVAAARADRHTPSAPSAEERESWLVRAAWAGGPELESELAAEIRAAHADGLAHRGVVDRTLTGTASSEPVKAPASSPRGVIAGALVVAALALAGAGEHLRRRVRRVAPVAPREPNADEPSS